MDLTVRLVKAGRRAYARKWSFLVLFVVAFFGSVAVLAEFDLLPEAQEPPIISSTPSVQTQTGAPAAIESPTRIEVAKISLAAAVTNPVTTEPNALDAELLKGAVRYPTSAKLGETGNVVIFGHSSYLPIVRNGAYKAFNEIQKLAEGDSITVYSSTAAYTYRVRSVTKERADDNTAIPLSVGGKVLTLVTCNSFGAKDDRFVVVADFVESRSLGA